MNMDYGMLECNNSKTYSWKIGSIGSDQRWVSYGLTSQKKSVISFFQIDSYNKNTQTGVLYFCEKTKDVSTVYNFVLVCKYNCRKKDIFVVKNNVNPRKIEDWFFYDVAKIKTDNLEKIICTIFKSTSKNVTENKDQKQGENSGKRKHEEIVILTEQSKRLKTKGLDILTEQLKEAYQNQEDSDITIKIGDKKYLAHKLILRSRSPVFHKMLQHDMVEKNEATVNISDCDPHVFGDFLLYLYTGKLENATKENMIELYCVSHKYDVNELRLDCIDFILNNLDNDIICDVITLATRHSEKEMLKHATTFLIRNAKAIFLTTKWQSFIKEYPIEANELIIKVFNAKETQTCSKK